MHFNFGITSIGHSVVGFSATNFIFTGATYSPCMAKKSIPEKVDMQTKMSTA